MENFLAHPALPSFVQFETDTNCNATCLICPRQKMKPRGTAEWSTLLKIIEETVPTAREVCPFFMQEPLLEHRLVALLDNIKQANRKAQTIVFTNMSAMTEALAKEIIQSYTLDKLIISFYGPTQKLYRKYQAPLNWRKTRRNIKKFMETRNLNDYKKPIVQMHYVAVPELLDFWPVFHNEWSKIVDDVRIVRYSTIHGAMPDLSGDQTKVWGPPWPRTPCPRLWTAMFFLANGDAVPCCLDYDGEVVLGNIREQSAEQIWRGTEYNALRKLHMEGKWSDVPICRDCKYMEYGLLKEWVEFWKKKNVVKVESLP